jgi:hypothetical protein
MYITTETRNFRWPGRRDLQTLYGDAVYSWIVSVEYFPYRA